MKVDVYRFDPRLWNRELIGTAAFNRESPRWISKVATMTMPNTNSFVPNVLSLAVQWWDLTREPDNGD
jgi:hypothetical protein